MFEDLMGRKQAEVFDDPDTRRACELWRDKVILGYGETGETECSGGVDVEIIDTQLGLCPRTADYCYTEFTPLELHYERGSRPFLEQVLDEVTEPGMGEREKALAIMRRCRDNRHHGIAGPSLFYGGSEEDLLKRGAIMCNEISRVFVCLCQIAGLPARTHSSHISGHMMAEVYTDGKWGWIDPMKGMAPVLDDDTPASAWDLHQDPLLFERQPPSFWDDVRPAASDPDEADRYAAYQMARNRDCYFHPREAMALGNYYVWESDRYTFPWSRGGPAHPERHRDVMREMARLKKKMGWPDYYFNEDLFEGDLKTRD